MEIIKVNSPYSQAAVRRIERLLAAGKVLIFPTDTVYGLVADAGNESAVRKVFAIKGRQVYKKLPFFVASIEEAKKIAEVLRRQEEFLRKVWPGKVTVVLQRKKDGGTIGLRIPDYPLLNQVLSGTKMLLTGTSANLSGRPASGDIKEIIKQFAGRKTQPDAAVDAGVLPASKPSTVVDLTSSAPKILRLGAVKLKVRGLYF